MIPTTSDFAFKTDGPTCSDAYLWPHLDKLIRFGPGEGVRVLDLGCGNGSTAAKLAAFGYQVTGVDPSADGIARARRNYPEVEFHLGSAYDDLSHLGRFRAVVSLEVIEHCYAPRAFARAVFDRLVTGGEAFISTPYHGYWKNLALAVTGKMDQHFTALWDGGHIKFWSEKTLRILLEETGFRDVRFVRAGRIPAFAKSMIAAARRP